MATKGYLKVTADAALLHRGINRLRAAGVPLSQITVGHAFLETVELLEAGDKLVVITLADLCSGMYGLHDLLRRLSERGATLRSLDEPALDTGKPVPDWQTVLDTLEGINRKCRSRRTREALDLVRAEGKKLGRPEGTSPVMAAKIARCLKAYYTTTKSVREICENEYANARTFYRFLDNNALPSRREVKADPQLNPLPQLQAHLKPGRMRVNPMPAGWRDYLPVDTHTHRQNGTEAPEIELLAPDEELVLA